MCGKFLCKPEKISITDFADYSFDQIKEDGLAVKDVSIDVHKGEMLVIMGYSGKSTWLDAFQTT